MKNKIDEKQWIHKMPDEKKAKVQKKETQNINGWGASHKPSASVWKTMSEHGYIKRINRVLDLFDIPKEIEIAADIGCGPWAGVFFARRWEKMYAVDPSWSVYNQLNLVKIFIKPIEIIEEYAQDFKLPQKAQIMFSINALNHGGDIEKSIENCMSNLISGGKLFLHLHLRDKKEVDKGHPIDLDDETITQYISKYTVLTSNIYDFDPLKTPGGHRTIVATISNE